MKTLIAALIAWAVRRLSEPSTALGIATAVAGAVAPKLGVPVDTAAQLLVVAIGAALAAATTSVAKPTA